MVPLRTQVAGRTGSMQPSTLHHMSCRYRSRSVVRVPRSHKRTLYMDPPRGGSWDGKTSALSVPHSTTVYPLQIFAVYGVCRTANCRVRFGK